MTVGSLFAGIGGFDLAAERVGWEVKWQVEIDPFCRRVLEKHWPNVRRYEDVQTVGSELGYVDVLCGGFPCQDVSNAGSRVGIDGERSGLWSEMVRLADLLRPRYFVVENVAALLARGMGRVLGDLAAIRFDAEWDCLPARAVGAPHIRDRIWLIAYASGERGIQSETSGPEQEAHRRISYCIKDVADAERFGRELRTPTRERSRRSASGGVSDAILAGLEGHERRVMALADYRRSNTDTAGPGWWAVEPNVGRVAHGVPARVDRLRGLGNAIVPQVAEWIFRRIQEAEDARVSA